MDTLAVEALTLSLGKGVRMSYLWDGELFLWENIKFCWCTEVRVYLQIKAHRVWRVKGVNCVSHQLITSQFQIHCLLCKNGSGPLIYIFFSTSCCNLGQQRALERLAGEKGSADWFLHPPWAVSLVPDSCWPESSPQLLLQLQHLLQKQDPAVLGGQHMPSA